MLIVNLLERLIDKKFYTKEEVQNKINVFYAMNVINEEQFAELTLKVEEKYVVVEEVAENPIEENLENNEIEENE